MNFNLGMIGLILSIAGILWSGAIFSESEKISQTYDLNAGQTISLDINLPETDIGFYKTTIVRSQENSIFLQILDPNRNIIEDKKIETKMAINYFDFDYGGTYTLKATNLSDNPITVNIELGDTNASELIYSGIVLFVGIVLILSAAYRRLKNYKTAQPEEKIS